MNSSKLDGLPVLVYANTFGDEETLPMVEIIETLRLQRCRGRRWRIQYTKALTGEGINEGIQWLKKVIEEDEQNALQMFKTWRRFKDILLNTRDSYRRCAHRVKRVVGKRSMRGGIDEEDHIKSKVSKDTSDKYQLQHYLTVLKDRRSHLFDEFKKEKQKMK